MDREKERERWKGRELKEFKDRKVERRKIETERWCERDIYEELNRGKGEREH